MRDIDTWQAYNPHAVELNSQRVKTKMLKLTFCEILNHYTSGNDSVNNMSVAEAIIYF